jgi:hypothetical protein
MSNTGGSFSDRKPTDPNGSAERNGYRARFYPGFVRRLAVVGADGSVTELYDQKDAGGYFFLPDNETQPWPASTLAIDGPEGSISLQIEDPGHQIGRIEIYLKGTEGRTRASAFASGGAALGAADLTDPAGVSDPPPPEPEPGTGPVYICEDGPVLCPPMCPTEGPG